MVARLFEVKADTAGLDRVAGNAEGRVVAAINDTVTAFVGIADATVPIDEGNLRRNKTIDGAAPGDLSATVTYNQEYGVFVHNGTRRMAGRPWAAQAMDRVEPEFERRMADVFRAG